MLFIGLRVECIEDGETEAAIVLIFNVDDTLLISEELGELTISATLQR